MVLDADRLVRGGRVRWILLDGEAVLYDIERRELATLNATGALLWQLLDGSASLEQLTADVSDGFGADPTRVRADLLALAEELLARGLVERS